MYGSIPSDALQIGNRKFQKAARSRLSINDSNDWWGQVLHFVDGEVNKYSFWRVIHTLPQGWGASGPWPSKAPRILWSGPGKATAGGTQNSTNRQQANLILCVAVNDVIYIILFILCPNGPRQKKGPPPRSNPTAPTCRCPGTGCVHGCLSQRYLGEQNRNGD